MKVGHQHLKTMPPIDYVTIGRIVLHCFFESSQCMLTFAAGICFILLLPHPHLLHICYVNREPDPLPFLNRIRRVRIQQAIIDHMGGIDRVIASIERILGNSSLDIRTKQSLTDGPLDSVYYQMYRGSSPFNMGIATFTTCLDQLVISPAILASFIVNYQPLIHSL
jgi:hypothetical protein